MKLVPVILCGGKGRRLDPHHPKQFQTLLGAHSMLQQTALRALSVAEIDVILAATLADYEAEVRSHLLGVGIAGFHILTEAIPQGTAKAIHNAAIYAAAHFGDEAILWVLPADHYIGDEGALKESLENGIKAACTGWIITFGMTPTHTEIGYGYMELSDDLVNDAYRVKRFVEKPDAETARRFIQKGYLWNSGMFLASAKSFIDLCERYPAQDGQSFDTAVLEKADRIAVVPCAADWSDIGTPEKLKQAQERIKG